MNDVFLHNPRCSKSRAALELVLRAMAEHPILVERPIVVRGGKAEVGRPPEKVREVL